jgi:DNA-binding NtrC family response regulator
LYYEFKDINPSPLTPDAINAIIDFDYNWPGNIRELLSFIKNIRAMFSSSRFDKNKISMLLELWKTHQADVGLANEFYNGKSGKHTKTINSMPQASNIKEAGDGLTPDEIYLIPEVEKELKDYESIYNGLLLDWAKDTSSEPPKLEDVSKKFRNNIKSSNYIRERFTGNGKINIRRKNVAKHLFTNSFSEFKIRVLPPFDKLK